MAIGLSAAGCALPHASLRRDDAAAIDGDAGLDAGCGDGETRCGAECVSTATSVAHCGACNRRCALPNAVASCSAGSCAIDRCNDGFGDCDSIANNGCESRLDAVANCGACGVRCASPTPVCDGATRRCSTGCSDGLTNCDGSCVDVNTNASHCGACARPCALQDAVAACTAGRCTISRCADNFGDCDTDPSNGCETPLGTSDNCGRCGDRCTGATPACDGATRACNSGCSGGAVRCGGVCIDTRANANHCGGCGRVCNLASATARCEMGTCVIDSCAPGFADCDRNPANGCEVNIRTSLTHCGTCGRGCAPPNAAAVCANGICSYAMCSTGFADCDGIPANGCEVDTRTSLPNCGMCRAACMPFNATASCVSGACGYTACAASFADCDGNRANGCEVDTRVAPAHCGGCRRSCTRNNATTDCRASSCVLLACAAGFDNCDTMEINGCEASLRDDVAHCGSCANRCPARANATPLCRAGTCEFTCNPAFGDCNMSAMDGCEQSLRDLAHCGACNRACSPSRASATCAAGVCAIGACNAGWANCDGMVSTGCETETSANAAHCGRCGNRCSPMQTCVAGVCT